MTIIHEKTALSNISYRLTSKITFDAKKKESYEWLMILGKTYAATFNGSVKKKALLNNIA